MTFSPDGRLLATASADQTVWLRDPATGREIGAPLTGHTDAVNAVAISPGGRLLATRHTVPGYTPPLWGWNPWPNS